MTRKKISYGGKEFPSVTALATHLGITRYVLCDRIAKGWPEEEWGEPARIRQHDNKSIDTLIKEKGLKVKRVGDFVNTKTNTLFQCLIHGEVHEASPSNVLQGSGLQCCYRVATEMQGLKKIEAAAEVFDSKLKRANPDLVRLGDYSGVDTPIWFLCTNHWEWRRQRPNDALNGHGLKCCLIESNTERAHRNRDDALARYLSYIKTYEDGNFTLVGNYIDRKTPIEHHCKRHGKTLPVAPGSLLGGQKMTCCWDAAMKQQGQERMAEAARDFVERLAKANPDMELVGEYLGTNVKTLFRCKKHNETHLAAPKQRLKGQGLHCCHVANGRAMGRLTGPLNGWQGDSVWQSLTGKSTRHEETWLYLFDSPDTQLLKYGITSTSLDERKRRSWLPGVQAIRYGKELIEPRYYAKRDDAVLIEAAYQFSYGCEAEPKLGIGWTELTDRSPDEFESLVIELEEALYEMGPWDFAEEYCDPLQFDKALALRKLQ
jgi:hypothetical protein